MALLEIDTDKLKPGIKFYRDVDFPNGVWTYTHIPPEAIKIIKTI